MIAKFGEQVVDAKVWAPAKRVGVHEAKTRLSELLRLVYGGQRLRLPPRRAGSKACAAASS